MATAVYDNEPPKAQDQFQVLLCKATYYLQAAAQSVSVTPATAMYDNMNPMAQDTPQILMAKLAYWASQVSGGGGGGAPLLDGSGPPGSLAGSKGQRYYDTTGMTFYTNVDGTTSGWAVG